MTVDRVICCICGRMLERARALFCDDGAALCPRLEWEKCAARRDAIYEKAQR